MDRETLAFCSNYKTAHKSPAKDPRRGLAKETLFVKVMRQINSATTTADKTVSDAGTRIGVLPWP